jgi:DNA repair exonuclease SbcCD ATPase subunit
MKRINFTQVSIKNFLSIGNNPLTLEFKPGLHIITGVNRDKTDRQNGIGKTSVIESVYFAIFGSTIRELKKDLIPNTFTNSTCEVKLDFNVEDGSSKTSYTIIRTLNPSKLYFYKNGQDVTRDSIKSTEEDIHAVLHASPSIFENCVIMTLNNTTPFMAKSKVDKRKFIEGIFNLEVFGQMMSIVREDTSSRKRVYEIELTKMEEAERTSKSLQTRRDTILESRRQKMESTQAKQVNNTNEKQKLVEQMAQHVDINEQDINDQIEKIQRGIESCDVKLEKLNKLQSQLSTEIKRHHEDLLMINSENAKCPMCLRAVDEHDRTHIDAERDIISNKIVTKQSSIDVCVQKISECKAKKQQLNVVGSKLTNKLNEAKLLKQQQSSIADRIVQIDAWLSEIDADIQSLKSDTTDVDDVLTESLQHVEAARSQVLQHRKHMELLDTVKYIVSEEGVKSYIVNKILELFNNVLNSYLSKMDANCKCSFNEYFEEEIINEKRKLCSYFNFSGAERKNIDFACLFTFMDMRRLQGNVTYNISIYDELFDSSLDEKGVELVTSVLKDRVQRYNECVMVISHRKESIQHATGDVIFLEKQNGITSRIDYNPFVAN